MSEATAAPPPIDDSHAAQQLQPNNEALSFTAPKQYLPGFLLSKVPPSLAIHPRLRANLKNFSIPGNPVDSPPTDAQQLPNLQTNHDVLASPTLEPESSNQNSSAPLMDPKVEVPPPPTPEVVRISLVDDEEESEYVEQESVLLALERQEMRDVTKILARYSSKHKLYIKAANLGAAQLEAERRVAANSIRQAVDVILWQPKSIQKLLVRGIRVDFRHGLWIIIEVGYRKSSWGGPYALLLWHNVFSKRALPAEFEIALVSTEKIVKGAQNETVLTGDPTELEYIDMVVERYHQSHPGISGQISSSNNATISSRLRHANPTLPSDQDPPQPQEKERKRNLLVTLSEGPSTAAEEQKQQPQQESSPSQFREASSQPQHEEAPTVMSQQHQDDSPHLGAGFDNSTAHLHRGCNQRVEDDEDISRRRDRRHSDPGQHHEKRRQKRHRHYREKSHRNKNKDKRRHRSKRHYSPSSSSSSFSSLSSSFSDSDDSELRSDRELPRSKRRRTESHELESKISEMSALAAVGGSGCGSAQQIPPPWFGPAVAPILAKLDQANARMDRFDARHANYRACYLQIDSNLPLIPLPLIADVGLNAVGARPANAAGGAVYFPTSTDGIQSLTYQDLDILASFYGTSFPGANLGSRRKAFQQFICI